MARVLTNAPRVRFSSGGQAHAGSGSIKLLLILLLKVYIINAHATLSNFVGLIIPTINMAILVAEILYE